MKKLMALPLLAFLAIPAMATTTETTTQSYNSTYAPIVLPATEEDSMMMEAEEEGYNDSLDRDAVEQERMEERMEDRSIVREERDMIDYQDRTRTNRERKALNTGSDASDDQ